VINLAVVYKDRSRDYGSHTLDGEEEIESESAADSTLACEWRL